MSVTLKIARPKSALGISVGMTVLVLFCVVALPMTTFSQDKYAVLIGVETYDEELASLDYAEEDAIEIGKLLEDLGFKTTVMTSQARRSSLKPNSAGKILKVLEARLRNCQKGDTLIVSLSGHGIQFKDDPLLPSGVRESYFCPEDADLSQKESLIGINKQIVRMMDDCQASKKLLMVDACRNEVLSDEGKKKSVQKKLELETVHEIRQSIPSGMTVLFSCQSKQVSWEHHKLKHSVFSASVLKYLSANADPQYYSNQYIHLDGLANYVRKSTDDYVFKHLSSDGQRPVLCGKWSDWNLGKIRELKHYAGAPMTALHQAKMGMQKAIAHHAIHLAIGMNAMEAVKFHRQLENQDFSVHIGDPVLAGKLNDLFSKLESGQMVSHSEIRPIEVVFYREGIQVETANLATKVGVKAYCLSRRGNIWANLREYEKAEDDLSESMAETTNEQFFADLLSRRASIRNDLRKFEAAKSDARKLIEMYPENAFGHFLLGFAARGAGDDENSIKYFSKAIELAPHYAHAYGLRAVAFNNCGELEKAIKDATISIALSPRYAHAYYTRAWAYESKNRSKEALEDLNKAISLQSRSPEFYELRARVYFKLGLNEKSNEDLEVTRKLRQE